MYENVPVGIRLPRKLLDEISKVEEEEGLDRSTVARNMIGAGLAEYRKQKALKLYSAGKVSISGAAKKAKLSIWDFELYAVQNGFKSAYSIEDLEEEIG